MSESPVSMASDEKTSLAEIALLFARLGATAFGGPAAHIAMIENEVVRRRRWLSEEEFLDLLGATNLIPGPNSTEMAIHVGWQRRRWAGLVVAGGAFILPAMAITTLCGFAYVRFGALPTVNWLLYGVKPVILGVVVQAIWGLLPRAAKTTTLRLLGGLAVTLSALGVNELLVLLGTRVASWLLVSLKIAAGRRAAVGFSRSFRWSPSWPVLPRRTRRHCPRYSGSLKLGRSSLAAAMCCSRSYGPISSSGFIGSRKRS